MAPTRLPCCLPLARASLLVPKERAPGGVPRRFVGPLQHVDELETLVTAALPDVHDAEAVLLHEARGVIAKARVERVPVVLENLIDPKLVDHLRVSAICTSSSYSWFQ